MGPPRAFLAGQAEKTTRPAAGASTRGDPCPRRQPRPLPAQAGTARGTWHGIVLASTATATLNDLELRHAAFGLDSRASSPLVQRAIFTENATAIRTNAGSLQVRNSVVSSNNQAIYSEGGTPLFDAITVSDNFDGIRLTMASAATIRNSVIRDQARYGIYASPSAVTTTDVAHCTLHQNHDLIFLDNFENGP